MEASSDLGLADDDTPTRHSSKLSLGSSPSILSGDEGDDDIDDDGLQNDHTSSLNSQKDDNDGSTSGVDDALKTTDKLLDEDTTHKYDNDDELDELFNGPLLPSTGDLDDITLDQDSASPLSSVPDDFPLSRSVSPGSQDDDPDNHLLLLSPLPVQQEKSSISLSNGSVKRESQSPTRETTLSNKSRRLSMAGRDLYSRLESEVGNTLDRKEEGEEEDNEPQDDPKVESPLDTTTTSSPMAPLPPSTNTITDEASDWGHTNEETLKISTQEEDLQRHKEALEALTHIEVEFARLRDKMYQEKMAELNEEAIKIANGTHPELVTLMTEIEEKKDRRIRTAEAWRKYQHGNFQRQFEGAEYQANVQFISKKTAMRRDLLSTTNGKRWRLEDEQNKLNDPLQKPGKLIPDAHTLRMQKQNKREAAMELQDIKDAIGFPRAPQVPGSSQQDIRDDLLLLGLGP